MRRSVCVLLLALFAIQASCSISHNFLNAIASTNGEAKIFRDDLGLYVEMDVADTPVSKEDTPKMLVSFVSQNTLLADKGCLDFDTFTCSSHVCEASKDEFDISYPYFTTKAQKLTKIEGFFDRKGWVLKNNAYYSMACDNQGKNPIYGKGRTGVIGLGIEDNSNVNYNLTNSDKSLFSVTLKNLTNGSIYFSTQSSLTVSKPVTLKTTTSWISEEGPAFWIWPEGNVTTTARVFIDLHADAIGIPNAMYKPLLNSFKKYGVDCKADDEDTAGIINKPQCALTGNLTDLPTLYLQVQGQNIAIPKEIYLKDAVTPKQEKVTFNFRELFSMHTGENYIDGKFENTIVLDSNFLTQYYANFKPGSIELSLKPKESPSSGSGAWKWIGIGAAVVIVVGGLVFFLKGKKSAGDEYSRE